MEVSKFDAQRSGDIRESPGTAPEERRRRQLRRQRREAIAAFAAEVAGTALDLDSDLERAGIGHLLKLGKEGK
jgi:hypothetical protein